jgi:hypothetical protein
MHGRPVPYRAEIIAPLLTSLAAGECCSVVGINGVGKSNMVQHLRRADVRQHYLGEQAQSLHVVTLDANLLASWTAWGFFEGLAEALLTHMAEHLPESDTTCLHAAHRQVVADGANVTRSLRHCSDVLRIVLQELRLVVLFDEFDPLFTHLPDIVFRNLRGLRDRHKYRLMYLTFSRERLTDLRDESDWDAIEPFVELLTLREMGLHPLQPADAAAEVVRFATRHDRSLVPDRRTRIVTLSGGHPALVRALTQIALDGGVEEVPPDALLRRSPALRLECRKIWDQFTSEEQDALWQIVRGIALELRQMQTLHLKGITHLAGDGAPAIFSPLLAAYLVQVYAPAGLNPPADAAPASLPHHDKLAHTPDLPLVIDRREQRVCYYGQDIGEHLSPLQYRMLAYLYERFGQLCTFDEVAQAVYAADKVADHRDPLAVLARRLRQRLSELVPDQPVLLRIYKGRGYRLGFPPEP